MDREHESVQRTLNLVYRSIPEVIQDLDVLLRNCGEQEVAAVGEIIRLIREARFHAIPHSDQATSILDFVPGVMQTHEQILNLGSKIEQRYFELLVDEKIADEFVAQGEIQINYTYLKGGRVRERVGNTSPDFVHKRLPIAIYCDSKEFHGPQQPAMQHSDREVSERLQAIGWRVLRPTGRQILFEPWRCMYQLRRAMNELQMPASRAKHPSGLIQSSQRQKH